MTTKSSDEVTIGVGDGRGNLFVHGSFESIEAVKRLIAKAAACTHPDCGPDRGSLYV